MLIGNRRTLIDFEKSYIAGVPDGMTIDNKDNVWIACWGGSQVRRVDFWILYKFIVSTREGRFHFRLLTWIQIADESYTLWKCPSKELHPLRSVGHITTFYLWRLWGQDWPQHKYRPSQPQGPFSQSPICPSSVTTTILRRTALAFWTKSPSLVWNC